jgi:transposase
MRTGSAIAPLSLAVEEREALERPKSAQALAQRARVVLACAAGEPNTGVAKQLGLTHQTVGKWRQRFLERRLNGLLDELRPGAPRHVRDPQIERVVRLTLESAPADATHWSTRAMAKRCGLSQSTVSRI